MKMLIRALLIPWAILRFVVTWPRWGVILTGALILLFAYAAETKDHEALASKLISLNQSAAEQAVDAEQMLGLMHLFQPTMRWLYDEGAFLVVVFAGLIALGLFQLSWGYRWKWQASDRRAIWTMLLVLGDVVIGLGLSALVIYAIWHPIHVGLIAPWFVYCVCDWLLTRNDASLAMYLGSCFVERYASKAPTSYISSREHHCEYNPYRRWTSSAISSDE